MRISIEGCDRGALDSRTRCRYQSSRVKNVSLDSERKSSSCLSCVVEPSSGSMASKQLWKSAESVLKSCLGSETWPSISWTLIRPAKVAGWGSSLAA